MVTATKTKTETRAKKRTSRASRKTATPKGELVYKDTFFGKKAVPAAAAGREMRRIRKKYGGATRRRLWTESARTDAVLHDNFTWDNDVCGEKWRDEEAGALLCGLHEIIIESATGKPMVDPTTGRPKTRALFTHVTIESGPAYFLTEEVARDPIKIASALDEALRQLKGLQRRYSHLRELSKVFKAIDRIVADHEAIAV